MSPSIPDGFNMNCTRANPDDLSSIICQAHLSNENVMGLKEQGYMNLESRIEAIKHTYKQHNDKPSSL